MPPDSPRVALFVTCLVDLFRPSVGFAAVRLLEHAGCRVEVPRRQTCCGQPAFNSGDRRAAEAIARDLIRVLETYDFVVAPSGSCAGMLRMHLPELFDEDPAMKERARTLSGRCHELVSFLVDVMGVREVAAQFPATVTYHDSCSGLRELGIKAQPRHLLAGVDGLNLVEMSESEVCCGFGGTFCVKYPEISTRMVSNKADRVE
ncbi:MAG: (Fe-S)-binding protein, partial [Geminicoccaceae bacterium]